MSSPMPFFSSSTEGDQVHVARPPDRFERDPSTRSTGGIPPSSSSPLPATLSLPNSVANVNKPQPSSPSSPKTTTNFSNQQPAKQQHKPASTSATVTPPPPPPAAATAAAAGATLSSDLPSQPQPSSSSLDLPPSLPEESTLSTPIKSGDTTTVNTTADTITPQPPLNSCDNTTAVLVIGGGDPSTSISTALSDAQFIDSPPPSPLPEMRLPRLFPLQSSDEDDSISNRVVIASTVTFDPKTADSTLPPSSSSSSLPIEITNGNRVRSASSSVGSSSQASTSARSLAAASSSSTTTASSSSSSSSSSTLMSSASFSGRTSSLIPRVSFRKTKSKHAMHADLAFQQSDTVTFQYGSSDFDHSGVSATTASVPINDPDMSIMDKLRLALQNHSNAVDFSKNKNGEKLTDAFLSKVANLTFIRELNLSGNDIKEIPLDVCNMRNLQKIILSKNELKTVPNQLENLASLRELELRLNQIRAWPVVVNKMEHLEVLDLGFNEISSIQYGLLNNLQTLLGNRPIALTTSLRSLDLSFNHIPDFPVKVLDFVNLRHLSLSSNALSHMPKEIRRLEHLETLRVADCGFSKFPEEVFVLTTLTTLDLSDNKIRVLPHEISYFPNLREIYLSSCDLEECLPLYFLSNARIIHLKNNRISVIPPEWQHLRQLEELNMSRNQLTEVPRHLIGLTQLRILDLSRNRIIGINPEFGRLSQLQLLFMECNSIMGVPSSFSNLTALQKVRLSNNMIESVPDLSLLTNLQTLKLADNRLKAFPPGIGTLSNCLRKLHLQTNRITGPIPAEVYQLSTLKILILKENRISEFSAGILNLSSLTTLDLDSNEITQLPVALSRHSALRTLSLNYNSDTPLPQEIIEWRDRCNVNLLNQFETPDRILKGLFIGSVNAASSRLCLRNLGVTHILVVAKELIPTHPQDFTYLVLPVEDTRQSDLKSRFGEANAFIEAGRQAGGVLVHCQAGVSRSATMVTAYVMWSQKLRLKKAFAVVRRARPQVFPNPGFRRQLDEYNKELFGNQADEPPTSTSDLSVADDAAAAEPDPA